MPPLRRFPAEWEPQSAIQFTFPHAQSDWAPWLEAVIPCFVAAISAVVAHQPALVVCAEVDLVAPLLRHLPVERLRLVSLPSNDTWARDHGGITIWEDGQPLILDFGFNGWGLKFPADQDNQLTARLVQAGVFAARHHYPGLVLEGGGIESDGAGTLLTTAECLLSPNRNPQLSRRDWEEQLHQWLGIERVLWLENGYLAGDDTDSHIDTLARFCNPHTIAYVQCTDPADEHFAALRAMEAELQALRTATGKPYELVPLPLPRPCFAADGQRLPATYANFLIINGAVLVPTYRVPEDEHALAILGAAFPDRTVVPIDCRVLIEQHGSLHCITMQYPEGVLAPAPELS